MTVRELLSRMDSRELSEWLAYDRIDPLPDPYWMTGLMCSTMANLWGKQRYTPQDFMPTGRGVGEPQSAAEGIAKFKAALSRPQTP